MNMKFSALTVLIFISLVAQAQEVPPDATWESDSIGIHEPPLPGVAKPTNQFQDLADPGMEGVVVPEPEIPADPGVQAGQNPEIPSGDLPMNPTVPAISTEVAPATTAEVNSVPTEAKPTKKRYKTNRGFKSSTYGDEIDHQQEAYFHRIFKNYNQQPTSEEAWEQAIGPRKSESYLIQKGDTLWDLSDTLFGDAYYWPKVWAVNKDAIFNPHEINSGLMVRFYPGTGNDAPTLNLANAKDSMGAVSTPLAANEKNTENAGFSGYANDKSATLAAPPRSDLALIPPPKKTPTPVLGKLPSSLPQYEMGALAKQKLQIRVEMPKNKFPPAKPFLAYYAADSSVDGVGKVTGTEIGADTASDDQIIYVKLDSEQGDYYVVQKNHSKVASQKFLGGSANIVEMQGEIEVLEKVNDDGVFRALVKKTIQPIEVGSLLVPGKLPMINVAKTTVEEGVGGVVIGGQFSEDRQLMGNEHFIYIDNGSSNGISEGQTLPVYRNERLSNPKVNAKFNDMVIGYVKIVRVTKDFATAFVLDTGFEIKIGDYVGTDSGKTSGPVSSAAPVEGGADDFDNFDDSGVAPDSQNSEGGDEEFEL